MPNKKIGSLIIEHFFPDQSAIQLREACPNKMLWEAIKKADATIISQKDVMQHLHTTADAYILPECLPAIDLGIEPAYMRLSDFFLQDEAPPPCRTWKIDTATLFQIEPLYIINSDFSWMIVLTTENLPSGEQLCVFVEAQWNA